MGAKFTIAAVVFSLAAVATAAGTTYLYLRASAERDMAESATQNVEQGYRAAIDHWQEDAEAKARQIEVLNDGYAKARAQQSVAEQYLVEHKLAEAIKRKPDLVAPVYNRMVAGMFQDISDATNRHPGPAGHGKTSKAGRPKAPAP